MRIYVFLVFPEKILKICFISYYDRRASYVHLVKQIKITSYKNQYNKCDLYRARLAKSILKNVYESHQNPSTMRPVIRDSI